MKIEETGCEKLLKNGHKCGVADAWGKEWYCYECDTCMKEYVNRRLKEYGRNK